MVRWSVREQIGRIISADTRSDLRTPTDQPLRNGRQTVTDAYRKAMRKERAELEVARRKRSHSTPICRRNSQECYFGIRNVFVAKLLLSNQSHSCSCFVSSQNNVSRNVEKERVRESEREKERESEREKERERVFDKVRQSQRKPERKK